MKKIFTNTNPFVLLLAPVMFALIMGVSYQVEQKMQHDDVAATTESVKATSLFVKGIALFKTVASVNSQKAW